MDIDWPRSGDRPGLLSECGILRMRGVPHDGDNRSLRRLGGCLGQPAVRAVEPSLDEGAGVQRVEALALPVRDRLGKLLKFASHGEFALHTDESFLDRPAHFVLLHCWQAAPSGGATEIADSRVIAAGVDRTEWIAWTQLRLPDACGDRCRVEAGVLRFNPAECSAAPLAPVQQYWLGRFTEGAQRTAFELPLTVGDLLLRDNHRMLHGRNAFNPACGRLLSDCAST